MYLVSYDSEMQVDAAPYASHSKLPWPCIARNVCVHLT